jgi:hypothetical protein
MLGSEKWPYCRPHRLDRKVSLEPLRTWPTARFRPQASEPVCIQTDGGYGRPIRGKATTRRFGTGYGVHVHRKHFGVDLTSGQGDRFSMSHRRVKQTPRRVLRLPDLDFAKSAVLNTLRSSEYKRSY